LTLLIGLIAGISCGILIVNEFWILSLLAFILIYLIENIRKPILTGNLADQVSNEILTSVISAQSFYATIVTSAIAILIGVFADNYGIGIALLIISGILFLFVILIGNPKIKIPN